ncbi:MAG TPA: hypothetical protein VIR38_07585 [Thalassobaculum sp.]
MFKTLARTVAVVAVACLPFAAVAESKHEHDHDHEAMAKHGGTIAEVGSYDVEVMLTGGNLVLYVYDEHGKDITKKASKGDALFVVDGASKKVTLAPADGALSGPLGFDAAPGADLDAVLRITVSGKTHTGKTDIHAK